MSRRLLRLFFIMLTKLGKEKSPRTFTEGKEKPFALIDFTLILNLKKKKRIKLTPKHCHNITNTDIIIIQTVSFVLIDCHKSSLEMFCFSYRQIVSE